MDLEVGLAGPAELAASLATAAHAAADLEATNHDAGALVVAGAHIPKVTGYLASSVTITADPAGVTVAAGAPYAPYVHARVPFFTDALTAREAAVVDLYTAHLVDVVDHITGA